MILENEVQVNFAELMDGREDFTPEEILQMELTLMDVLAVKHAGAEHLVHWDAAGMYQ